MSSVDSNGVHLGILPSAIVTKILDVVQASFGSMTLISPQWNSAIAEYIAHAKRRYTIDLFRVIINPNPSGEINLSMRIPHKFRRWFEIKGWNMLTLENELVLFSPLPTTKSMLISARPTTNINEGLLLQQVRGIVGRASRIDKLEFNLDILRRKADLFAICNRLGDVVVEEIAFTRIALFIADTASTILDVLRTRPFERLILTGEKEAFVSYIGKNLDTFLYFFSQAARLVSKVIIKIPYFDTFSWQKIDEWEKLANDLTNNAQVKATLVHKKHGQYSINIVARNAAQSRDAATCTVL